MITDHLHRPAVARDKMRLPAGGCGFRGLCGRQAAEHTTRLMPHGLCADREPHDGHRHDSATLGTFWCTADQDDREPGRSERARTR